MDIEQAKLMVQSVPYWHHKFEIYPGVMTPGNYDPEFLLEKTKLPNDLRGKRILDVGTSDGYFALQLARRGAQVTAIDYRGKDTHGYGVMERLNSVRIEYQQMNLYDLKEGRFGEFDIVMCLGVLYHLPDMFRGLHLIRGCCRGELYLESHSENDFCRDVAAARYYRGNSLANDHTNFWSPNRLCIFDMLYDAGFDVERDEEWGDRIFIKANAAPVEGVRAQKKNLAYGLVG